MWVERQVLLRGGELHPLRDRDHRALRVLGRALDIRLESEVAEDQNEVGRLEVGALPSGERRVVRFDTGGVRFSTSTRDPPTCSAAHASG